MDNVERIRRDISSMHLYFNGLIAHYPEAVIQGRVHLWAKAAHSYIDLIASQDETPREPQDPGDE